MLEKGMTEKYITALTECARHNINGYKLMIENKGKYTECLIRKGIFLFSTSYKRDVGYFIHIYILKSKIIRNKELVRDWCSGNFYGSATAVEIIYEKTKYSGEVCCKKLADENIHTYIFKELDNLIELYNLHKEKEEELEKKENEKRKKINEINIEKAIKMFNRYCRNK